MIQHGVYWRSNLLTWLLVCGVPLVVQANDDVAISDIFGRGAHAYFSGNYRQAHELMTTTIAAGSSDPRAYYYRGLCALQLGREPDARIDFQKGAQLELSEGVGPAEIARSLERAQGRSRLMLESYRSDARMAMSRQREQRRLQRYETIRRIAPPIAASATAAAGEEMQAPTQQPAAAAADPFGKPAAPKPAADPFGADPAKPAADPFGKP